MYTTIFTSSLCGSEYFECLVSTSKIDSKTCVFKCYSGSSLRTVFQETECLLALRTCSEEGEEKSVYK